MNSVKVFRHPMSPVVICQRKHLTKRMLQFDKIPVPVGADFAKDERTVAQKFFDNVPHPVVLKPTNSGGSHGVTVGVSMRQEFDGAWRFVIDDGEPGSNVLIEQFVQGIELHALVVCDEALSIVARIQPFVVGDGLATIEQLIERVNMDRSVHYRSTQLPIVVKWEFIKKQGYSADGVPGSEEIVYLNPLGLPAEGALLIDLTSVVAPAIKELAVNARKAIPGLEIGGVDILVEDILDVDSAVVLEVNTAPSLNLHRYVTHGQVREVTEDIVDYFQQKYLASANVD